MLLDSSTYRKNMCILCFWLIWNLRQKILTVLLADVLPFKADGYRSVWFSLMATGLSGFLMRQHLASDDTWICGWNRNIRHWLAESKRGGFISTATAMMCQFSTYTKYLIQLSPNLHLNRLIRVYFVSLCSWEEPPNSHPSWYVMNES